MWKKIWILSLSFTLVVQAHAQKQDDMRKAVEYLASQELGGRFPATLGDTPQQRQYGNDGPASELSGSAIRRERADGAKRNATACWVGVGRRGRRPSAGRRRATGSRQTRRGASVARSGIPRRSDATRIGCGWRGRAHASARREG